MNKILVVGLILAILAIVFGPVVHAQRFEALGMDNIRVIMYEGSGHALQDPPGAGDHYIREDALSDMLNFITTTTKE